ncbi:uncharacterized protein [Malus domestica]|uniref:uncharacterized protein n=1 Tax=Malus domestica TaxID=3750 RepID=UPI003974B2CB
MTHANLMNNYFNPNSVNPYFRQKRDRAGRPSFSLYQKVIVALQMIAYGSPANSMDETHGMSKSTCLDTLEEFCDTIVQLYKDEYLREPNQEDLNRLIRKAEDRGFPGMIGSLDCMHWDWKNCPTGWQKGFSGRSRKPTVVLEAVASYDTWIWHAFFGVPGSITIHGHSPLFNNLTEVEDERDGYIDGESDDDQEDPNRSRMAREKIYDKPNLPFNPRTCSISIDEYMRCYRMIRSCATNKYLQ